MGKYGSDLLYAGLGIGALYLIFRSTKPLTTTVSDLSGVITNAADVVNPILKFAAQGTNALTANTGNPATGTSLFLTLWNNLSVPGILTRWVNEGWK